MEYVRKLRREVIRKDGLFIADPGRIGIAVHDAKSGSTEYYFTQKVEGSYHGTGDCFAAVLKRTLFSVAIDGKESGFTL